MPSATFCLALRQSPRYPYLQARISTTRMSLKPGEVMMALDVDVPASLFTRLVLRAAVKVPNGTLAPEITAEVQNGISDAMRAQLGLRVHVTTEPEE